MDSDKKYYAVVYCHDGTIHLWEGESKEACEEKLFKVLSDKRCHDRCKRTTIIKRDAKSVGEEGYIFGAPDSLNILAKFDKVLAKGKVEYER